MQKIIRFYAAQKGKHPLLTQVISGMIIGFFPGLFLGLISTIPTVISATTCAFVFGFAFFMTAVDSNGVGPGGYKSCNCKKILIDCGPD